MFGNAMGDEMFKSELKGFVPIKGAPRSSLLAHQLCAFPNAAFSFSVEFHRLVSIDRLQHADPGELHWAVVLRGLGDAARGSLNFFHCMFGLRNLFREPRDRVLQREQLPAAGQFDRFVEASLPAVISHRRGRPV
jgi:hypothetical protein